MNTKITRVLVFSILVTVLLSSIQFLPGVRFSRSSELTEVSGKFIEAVEALDQDQYGRASRLLEKYTGDPPLEDYSKYLLARADLGGGKGEKALSVLERISPGNGVLPFEKFYLKSKVLLEMGRPGLAGESAERALGKAVTEEEKRKILELQLTIAVNSNNYSDALKRGIDLVEVTNLRFVGEKRDHLLDRLRKIIQEVSFDNSGSLEHLNRYIDLLINYGEYRRARSILLRNMGNWTGSLKYRAYFNLAWIDGFKVDHPEEARWTFQRLLGMNLPGWFEAKAKYYHTLFQAGETDNYDLVEKLLEVGREFPGSYYGKLAVNRAFAERTKGVSTLTLDHELERFKNSMTRSAVKDATWRLFYRSFSEGKYKLAKDYLVSLESFYDKLPPELVFWRYKTNASSNGSTDYLKLVAEQNENPVNYYSLLASRKGWSRGSFNLRDTWKARELDLEEYEIKATEKELPASVEKSLVYSIVFKNHGLYETAVDRLKRLEPELSRKDYLFLKSQWERLAGEYKASLKSSTELMRWYYSNNQPPPLTVVNGAFPTYYGGEVSRAAARFGVPRELIFSIIRQESAFAKDAYGRAGEHGLMQIMPGTAQGIADDLEMNDFQPEDTFDPGTNIKMGSYYISKQLGRQNDDIRLALAAYNGGPGNVRRWKSSFGSNDVDLFVEKIPIGYTKDYVKSVYRNYLVYRALLGN